MMEYGMMLVFFLLLVLSRFLNKLIGRKLVICFFVLGRIGFMCGFYSIMIE